MELALEHHSQGRLEEAEGIYKRVLQADPNQPDALHLLGVIAQQAGKNDVAADLITRALAIKPDFAEAHCNLGAALKDLGRPDEAAASHLKALAIKPDYAEAHNNLGCAFRDMERPDEAMASFLDALAIKPDYAEARKNLGILQLLKGDFRNGWENFNCRWSCADLAPSFRKYLKPLWRGGAVDGKRLLVWEEQGVGDSILFASMIPDLIERGADLILGCDRRLIPLFSRSFPAITCAATDDPELGKTGDKTFDLHAPLGDAGRWLRRDLASFPARPSYLAADGGQRDTLRDRYLERGNGFLIGIAWHSKGSNHGEKKSMTLLDLRPVLETPGITFVDLQYGDTGEERNAFTAETGIEVFHDDGVDQMADLDIFASQVAAMDMVVTISNTTAHMAGALGVPTLLMLGTVPIWYWMLERQDSPWYPSLRLFRQHERGNWQGVVERVREELAGRI